MNEIIEDIPVLTLTRENVGLARFVARFSITDEGRPVWEISLISPLFEDIFISCGRILSKCLIALQANLEDQGFLLAFSYARYDVFCFGRLMTREKGIYGYLLDISKPFDHATNEKMKLCELCLDFDKISTAEEKKVWSRMYWDSL